MSKLIEIKSITDPRGTLVVAQEEIPFQIRRVFFIFGANATRGCHRHKLTKMALIAQQGQVEVYCQNQHSELTYQLNKPNECLLLDPEDWHSMNFSKDAILLVLCSELFDRNDYIVEKYR